ncbi:MAG: 4Fe-4S binding protein [Candidatus Aenigmarchaeota archaeon]|nr:4Fe-4S binding protein [Candidatus Aenigmarchaeota archaeon]MCK5234855.1 4Fe-4S binding protein [Candidatus Aenigmarchaeota archaeon]MCK5372842.1 4Fe-4S binding protein [Candidatus Aenigmarchaeota archaeon]MCK5452311.1 4Fe-4S binding protein [Candidatus Aenigmarchaeota archaeon]
MAVKINLDECMKCMACVSTCGQDALKETDKGPVVDAKKCTDCGDCIDVCPANCIKK